MEEYLNLEELFELKKRGYKLLVEVKIDHNINNFECFDSERIERVARIREIGEILWIGEDEDREVLLKGEWLGPFLGASKYIYQVDFGDIKETYSSNFLADPGYAIPRYLDPSRIEDFFSLKEGIMPENPEQLIFDFYH